MKELTKDVKTKKDGKTVKVSEVAVPEYETLDELVAAEEEGKIVAMFNQANCIRIMGNERAKFTEGRTSKKARRELAFNLLTTDELMKVAQDANALNDLLDSDAIQARVDEHLNKSA